MVDIDFRDANTEALFKKVAGSLGVKVSLIAFLTASGPEGTIRITPKDPLPKDFHTAYGNVKAFVEVGTASQFA